MTFDDVLVIKNGRNQKNVEDPAGMFPIYGSGGIMGYANDYICQANTVIIGRKGNINKPIFVEEPFWNVDTAFGLEAKRDVLLPKYLYYFCCRYDFERLNKAVTIPSLTKADLLKIDLDLPPLDVQAAIVDKLANIERIISLRRRQISQLNDLIKARFVEMTEELNTVPTRMGDVASYINGYAFKPTDWGDIGLPIIRIQNLNDRKAIYNHYSGIIDEKYRVRSGDVLVSWATHLEAYIWRGGDAWLNQHIFRVVFDKLPINKTYFVYSTEDALKQAFRNAHGFKPTMEHIKRSDFENAIVKLPPLDIQDKFAAFVTQIDKSKSAILRPLIRQSSW